MSVTLSLVGLVAFSFIAGEALQRIAQWRQVILSGAEYALIGVALGPLGAGAITDEVLAVMTPAAWVLVGMVGFIKGLTLYDLTEGRPGQALAGLLVSALTMIGIGLACGCVLYTFVGAAPVGIMIDVSVLGAAGAVVSPRLVKEAQARLGARGRVIDTLLTMSLVGAALAVVVAGLAMDWQRASDQPALHDTLRLPHEAWLVMGILVGLVCGVLFVLFHRDEKDDERTFLATTGVVIFASGVAAALGSSPLLVGMTTGVMVSMFSAEAAPLRAKLETLERPLTIVLMLFAGALFMPLQGAYWSLPVAYVAARALSLLVWPRLILGPLGSSRYMGQVGAGMRSQGVIAVAISVALHLAHAELAAVADAILIGAVLSEFGAGHALRRLLADAGELRQVDPAADEVSP